MESAVRGLSCALVLASVLESTVRGLSSASAPRYKNEPSGTVAAEDARVCACPGASFTVCSNLARPNEKEDHRTSPDAAAGRPEKVREDRRGLGSVIGKNASQEFWNAAEPPAKLFKVIPRYPILICVLHWHVQHLKRYLVFLVVTRSIHASVHPERRSRPHAIRFLLQV